MVVRDPPSKTLTRAFGRAFRAKRVAAALTQPNIAARTGIAVSHLSEIETGVANNVTLATMQKLAASVGMDIEVKLVEPPPPRVRTPKTR